jgi:hypothetical protein
MGAGCGVVATLPCGHATLLVVDSVKVHYQSFDVWSVDMKTFDESRSIMTHHPHALVTNT